MNFAKKYRFLKAKYIVHKICDFLLRAVNNHGKLISLSFHFLIVLCYLASGPWASISNILGGGAK